MITPDGTVLQPLSDRDFKYHIDKNGEEYMIEGGFTDNLIYSVNEIQPEILVINSKSPFELIRKWVICKINSEVSYDKYIIDMTDNELSIAIRNTMENKLMNSILNNEVKFRLKTNLESNLVKNQNNDDFIKV